MLSFGTHTSSMPEGTLEGHACRNVCSDSRLSLMIVLQVIAAVYCCASEELKAEMESEMGPLLGKDTPMQGWAAGFADREAKNAAKPASGRGSKATKGK